ncbi:hypothetical protein AXG93_3857s1320 [Marchantia polymorpha subsp. ruderalis]|uniref:30S ribosomal protein S21, chloroplastic n=1 Tax=Marchantia polymorpha subsp. ruderalis TaxID=1480154 RepID=A0A176W3B7_MARPO|nr:hypothetical protein AXG93_3857s1320 [Marchantia polymorpha subsp. ruderalis]
MAMASSSALMAARASVVVAQSPRCSIDSPGASSSAASGNPNNNVKFPLSNVLRQLKETSGAENLSVGSDRDAILDPQMKFANLMWFRGAYNAQIFVSEDEPADSVVRRFRKAVMQAGVIPECRRRRFFETPPDIVKRKQQNAQRRKSRRFTPRNESFGPGGEKKEGGAGGSSGGNDDDDFWGFAEES